MGSTGKSEPFYFPPSLDGVQRFADALNLSVIKIRNTTLPLTHFQGELRRLVQAWINLKRNTKVLFNRETELAIHAKHFEVQLIPTTGPTLQILLQPGRCGDVDEEVKRAHILFCTILLNPFSRQLIGPCRHCDRYFVQTHGSKNIYCSKLCGQRQSARNAVRAKRMLENEIKLKEAERYISEWNRTHPSRDWKTWVSRAIPISKNWLTLAVRDGKLAPPPTKDRAGFKAGQAAS